jgi:hypothetical protein
MPHGVKRAWLSSCPCRRKRKSNFWLLPDSNMQLIKIECLVTRYFLFLSDDSYQIFRNLSAGLTVTRALISELLVFFCEKRTSSHVSKGDLIKCGVVRCRCFQPTRIASDCVFRNVRRSAALSWWKFTLPLLQDGQAMDNAACVAGVAMDAMTDVHQSVRRASAAWGRDERGAVPARAGAKLDRAQCGDAARASASSTLDEKFSDL